MLRCSRELDVYEKLHTFNLAEMLLTKKNYAINLKILEIEPNIYTFIYTVYMFDYVKDSRPIIGGPSFHSVPSAWNYASARSEEHHEPLKPFKGSIIFLLLSGAYGSLAFEKSFLMIVAR